MRPDSLLETKVIDTVPNPSTASVTLPIGHMANILRAVAQRGAVPIALLVAGLFVMAAAIRMSEDLTRHGWLLVGAALAMFGGVRIAVLMRAQKGASGGALAILQDHAVPMFLHDPSPLVLSDLRGGVWALNLAAQKSFSALPASDLTHISGCLTKLTASPASLVARLAARAQSHGVSYDDINGQTQVFRLVVQHLPQQAALMWRVEAFDKSAFSSAGAEGIGLPMLTANRAGVVLFCNSALRHVLGRRPKSLTEIAPLGTLRSGEELQITGADGPTSVMLVELPSRAERREIYLLPLPKPQDGSANLGTEFENLPVALMHFAADGQLRAANLAARDIMGLSHCDGCFFHDLFDALGRPASDWLIDIAEERLPSGSQVVRAIKSPLDGPNFMQVTLRRMVHQARPGVLAVIQDANALKTLEAQFVQSQKMQAIGQLAGGVAHDFNNLLTAISGNTDLLLLRHAGDDPSFPDLMQIRQNANRAAALVGQLLAFSRKQTLQPEYLDMQDVFSDLTYLLNRLVGEKLQLLLMHGDGIGTIRADRRQLEQVIINLVVNARDAMPNGGTITLTTEALHLAQNLQRDNAAVPAGDYVKISITDTGTGMPNDILQKIFEPFFTTKKAGEGTGLGLSTAYGIVKQSGGFIFVDSTVGQGTTFTLYFPIHNRPAGEVTLAAKPAVIRQGDGVVLLVEDEAPVRAFAARALRLRGYTVLEAATGEEALAMLRDGQVQVDLFLSDVIMPGMDGPTWVRDAQVARPQVPVIFVSGYAEDVMNEHQARIANSTFLPKPFSLAELTLAVQEKLQT